MQLFSLLAVWGGLLFDHNMPRRFFMLYALVLLLLGGCQSVSKRQPPDVPAVLGQGDLALVDTALKASPSQLAVFQHELASKPLDPSRSGVIVDLDRQRAYVYSEGQLVAATRIASGKPRYRTPTGDFRIGQKNRDHSSNLYGKLVHSESGEEQPGEVDARKVEIPDGMMFRGAPMKNFMRFNTLEGQATAIGFHQGHVPGRPASHGCLRLPARPARDLFKLLPRGTPVFVYGEAHGHPSRALPVELPKTTRGNRG